MTANRSHPAVDLNPRVTVLARLYGNPLDGVLAVQEDTDARDAVVSDAQFLRELRRDLRAAPDYISPPGGRA